MITEATVLLDAAFEAYPDTSKTVKGYILTTTQINNEDGLHIEIYRKEGSSDYIISFRGTETSQVNDISADINLGWPQYEQSRDDIQAIIKSLLDKGGKIDLTGHSLGGALAQFTAYELAKDIKASGNHRLLNQVSLTTWNALGGVWGLERNGGYDASVVDGLNARHYFRSDDLVARLGKGHVGGETFRLDDPEGLMAGVVSAHMLQELNDSLQAGAITSAAPLYFDIADSSQTTVATALAMLLLRLDEVDPLSAIKIWLPLGTLNDPRLVLDVTKILGTAIVQQTYAGIQDEGLNKLATDEILKEKSWVKSQAILTSLLQAVQQLWPQIHAKGTEFIQKIGDTLLALGHLLIAADPNSHLSLSELQIWQREQRFADDLATILGGASLGHCLPGRPSLAGYDTILNAHLQQLYTVYRCPLVLDLDGDGLETLALGGSDVRFDLDADGTAEACGWIGATEALLVRDRNGDGRIDSGLELFGDHTLLSNGMRAEHGFAALADLDANRDGRIDAADAAWSELGLWRDINSDGDLDAGEWLTLASQTISALELSFTAGRGLDAQGNDLRLAGRYRRQDGSHHLLADVWLAVAATTPSALPELSPVHATVTTNVSAPGTQPLSSRWMDIGGVGQVGGLLQAVEADGSGRLRGLLDQWLQADDTARQVLLAEIVFSWAGLASQPQLSGNLLMDARIPAALLAFSTNHSWNIGWDPNDPRNITLLQNSFQALCRQIGTLLEAGQLLSPLWSRSIVVDADGLPQLDPARFELALQDQLNRSLSDEQLIAAGRALRSHDLVSDLLSRALRARAMENLAAPDRRLWLLLLPKRQGLGSSQDWTWTHIEAELIEAGDETTGTLSGGGGNDVLLGSHQSEQILTDDGDDLIVAGAGDDTISSSSETDNTTIVAGAGHDSLHLHHGKTTLIHNLGDGYDRLSGNSRLASNELILGPGIRAEDIRLVRFAPDLSLEFGPAGSGIRLVNLFPGNNFSAATAAVHTIRFSDGSSWSLQDLRNRLLTGDDADNHITGFINNDTLRGEAGHDILYGRDGLDLLLGGSGNDSLDGEGGGDRLEGGEGDDQITFRHMGGEDTVLGGAGTNQFLHYRGDVLLAANAEGNGAGINTLDLPLLAPEDLLLERQGDLLKITYKNASLAGYSTIRVEDFFRDFTVLNRWNPLQFINIGSSGRWDAALLAGRFPNTVMGNSSANKLSGSGSDEWIDGLQGNDLLQGLAGQDTLQGGAGNDTLLGGAGNDLLLGGDGVDTASWAGMTTPVQVDLSLEEAQDSGSGLDSLRGIENLLGGSGHDQLRGHDGANRLDGGDGDDTLDGGGGNDTLVGGNHLRGDSASYARATAGVKVNLALTAVQNTGGAGSDQLSGLEHLIGSAHHDTLIGSSGANRLEGGDGNDTLQGGAASDTLIGGDGADLFLYASLAETGNGTSRDWILDLSSVDRIDLSAIDARSDLTGNQAFVWIGSAAFTALGQLRYTRLSNGNGLLEGNCTGSLATDLQLELSGAPDLAGGALVVL